MGSRWSTPATVFVVVSALAGCGQPAEPAPPSTTTVTVTPSAAPPPATADTGPPMATPVIAAVVAPPVPVPGTDGKVHLAYELAVANALAQDVTLTSVGVRSGDRTLLELSGDELGRWTRLLGSPAPTTKLGPSEAGTVWLDITLEGGAPPPADLVHTIGVSVPQPHPPLVPAQLTETVAPVTVLTRKPVALSPPLSGPSWLDVNGCCGTSTHRMALNPINGKLWGAERFAIDYVQLSPDGRLFAGDPAKVENYPYFGADILAAGDGPVVSVRDGLPEQVPGRDPTGLPLDQYAGNHIVQDLGDGNYALYAHIKTGTVKVKPGDRLTAGQVIGSVGNTGNTSAPHLHFHVMDGPDPLHANGLPFVFSKFRLDSRLAQDGLDTTFDGEPAPLVSGFTGREEKGVMPLDSDVMSYAAR